MVTAPLQSSLPRPAQALLRNGYHAQDSYIEVPNRPGIGVDIDEDACARYPSHGNINAPDAGHDYTCASTSG
jgi:L-alanine-DL-glutamate epimerase-like enolase superfamily enzyme